MATLTYEWQNIANWTVYRANGSVTFWIDAKLNRQDINGNYSVIDTRLNSTAVNPISGTGYNFQLTGSSGRSGSEIWYFADETILTGQYTDWHNNDGTKSTYIEAYVYNRYWSIENTFGAWVDLPAIPRSAKVTGANDFNDEQNGTFTFSNPANFQLIPSLRFYLDGTLSKTISREKGSYGSPYTLELTTAERDELRTLLTARKNCDVRFHLDTYNGNTFIGSNEVTKKFSIVNADPTFNDFDFEDVNATTLALTGDSSINVNGYSNIQITIDVSDKATANKNATMSRYRALNSDLTPAEIVYSDSQAVSGTINGTKTGKYEVYAEDSRGNTTLVTKLASVVKDYQNIYINKQTSEIERDNNGVGGGAILTLNGTIWNNSFGSVTNSIKSVTYRFKKTNESTWTTGTTTITPTISNNEFTFTGLIAGDNQDTTWSLDGTFNVEVIITDELSSSTIDLILGSSVPTMSFDKEGIGILCAYDPTIGGALQVKGETIGRVDITIDGTPVKTGRIIDGKDEYIYYQYLGYLPNNAEVEYHTGTVLPLNNIELVTGIGGNGYRASDSSWFEFNAPRPDHSSSISITGYNYQGYFAFYVGASLDRSNIQGWGWVTFTYRN